MMLGRKKFTVSGIDFNTTSISFCRFVPADNEIINICIQPVNILEKPYWEAVSESFMLLAKELKLKKENLVISMPSDQAIIKKITIDSDEPEPINTLNWELNQQLIRPVNDYLYDFQKIDLESTDDFSTYLAAGFKSSTVTNIDTFLRKKKYIPLVFDIDIFALINVFEYNYPEKKEELSLLIYSEISITKLILTENGVMKDFDIVDDSEEMHNSAGFMDIIIKRSKRLLLINDVSMTLDSIKIYLTGANFNQTNMAESALIRLSTAEILNPFKNISFLKDIDGDKIGEFAPQLSVATGLALRGLEVPAQ